MWLILHAGVNILDSWATMVDCGDAPLTWLDNNVAFKQLDKSHLVGQSAPYITHPIMLTHIQVISGRESANTTISKTPRILTLGGDHATTLSALRSTHQRWGKVSVIHFDSHLDTWDPAVLGGGISHYA